MTDLIPEVLLDAAKCFTTARRNLLEGAAMLHHIAENELWQVHFNSFSEYVESECQISLGFASKLLKNYRHYIVEGQMQPQQLEGVDYEKAYLALSLPGSFSEKLEKARLLTRQELKAERAEQGGEECSHEHQITICAKCNMRIV